MIVSPTANRAAVVGESIVTCGGVLPGSMRTDAADDAAPRWSRTVSVAVNEPAAVYVWLVVGVVVVTVGEPSPKLQTYVSVSPASGSELALPSKLTVERHCAGAWRGRHRSPSEARLAAAVGSILRTSPPFE